MDFNSFEIHELIALAKALSFVKFESKEPGASAIAGSPLLGKIYAQATETLWTKAAEKSPLSTASHYINNGWPKLEERADAIDAIKFHITQVENWNSLEDDLKAGYVEDLIYPLKTNTRTIKELLDYGNAHHNKNDIY